MIKFISKCLIFFSTATLSYLTLRAYGFNWQWVLSILAIFWIGYGVYVGESDHD